MVKRLIWTMAFAMCLLMELTISAQAAELEEYPYIIQEGTVYYESSWGFGSGRCGTVEQENIYTNIPCEAKIWLYSFLNENGNVISFGPIEEGIDISTIEWPEDATALWVNFWGPVYWNGWVDSSNVSLKESSKEIKDTDKCTISPEDIIALLPDEEVQEMTPEEVIEQIDVVKELGKTAIVVDVSGSMYDNQKEVMEQLGKLTFTEDTIIEVFADDYAIVSYEDLMEGNYEVGTSTDIYRGLNALQDKNIDILILISDLGHNGYTLLGDNFDFSGVVIYNPDIYDQYSERIMEEMEKSFGRVIVTYTISK